MDYDASKLKSLAEKKRKRKEKKKKQKEEKAGQVVSKADVREETTIGSTASITTNSSKISNVSTVSSYESTLTRGVNPNRKVGALGTKLKTSHRNICKFCLASSKKVVGRGKS